MVKKNNKGFSLIELIVTMAIMAIVVTGSVSIYQYVSTAKVRQATSYIGDELTNTRVNTISKEGNWRMRIIVEDNHYYVEVLRNSKIYEKKDLGKVSDVTIKYDVTSSSGGVTVVSTNKEVKADPTTWPMVTYNSGSGAFMLGMYPGYVSRFEISNPRLTEEIILAKTTGKHYVKK